MTSSFESDKNSYLNCTVWRSRLCDTGCSHQSWNDGNMQEF